MRTRPPARPPAAPADGWPRRPIVLRPNRTGRSAVSGVRSSRPGVDRAVRQHPGHTAQRGPAAVPPAHRRCSRRSTPTLRASARRDRAAPGHGRTATATVPGLDRCRHGPRSSAIARPVRASEVPPRLTRWLPPVPATNAGPARGHGHRRQQQHDVQHAGHPAVAVGDPFQCRGGGPGTQPPDVHGGGRRTPIGG